MKAFLSHSWSDKEFVTAVAEELGRQFCVFDEYWFRTGEEFKTSIEQGLDESSVFVLFASIESLKSIYVNFEINEAWYQKLQRNLRKSLVYLIDSSVTVHDLPNWLQRSLVQRENAPQIIARAIRAHLDEFLRERQTPYFLGRARESEELQAALVPIDGSRPPHVVLVSGLPGIGRRSLVRHVIPSILGLRESVEIRIDEGDSIHDICVKIADRVEPYSTDDGLKRIVASIRALSEEDALRRATTNIRILVDSNAIPILTDEGGMLDSEGSVSRPMQVLVESVEATTDAYCVLVSMRRPQQGVLGSVKTVVLQPLAETAIKQLLAKIAADIGLTLKPDEISILAQYVAGYPPAAYFAVQEAKTYGLPIVLGERDHLARFRYRAFVRRFADSKMSPREREILRLLASYSPLPLQVITKTLEADVREISQSLIRLIDLAFVAMTDDRYYRIADPLADPVEFEFGFLSIEEHQVLVRHLLSFVEIDDESIERLELSRVLFRAAQWSLDENVVKNTTRLANDLIRLAETAYHQEKYSQAVDYALSALEERPRSESARSYLIRAYIQSEKYGEAEAQLRELERYAPRRDVLYLSGFLERKRGNIHEAIRFYNDAAGSGRRGGAISRELGYCYLLAGDVEQASIHIENALDRDPDNPFVLDLLVQVALRRNDETAARIALARLEKVASITNYNHRLSRVEYVFTGIDSALAAAETAAAADERPPFQVLSQLAYLRIEKGQLAEAEQLLAHIDQRFGNSRRDIRIAHRCRLEIARRNFRGALAQAERISDKASPYYKRIRFDGIKGELSTSALTDTVRASYEKEMADLEVELASVSIERFIPESDDTSSA